MGLNVTGYIWQHFTARRTGARVAIERLKYNIGNSKNKTRPKLFGKKVTKKLPFKFSVLNIATS